MPKNRDHLRSYPTPLPLTLPRPGGFGFNGKPLIDFHAMMGKIIDGLTEEQRATAYVHAQKDDDGDLELGFGYLRYESEWEYYERIKKERDYDAQREAQDLKRRRKLYEQLKKEFGD